MLAGSQYRQQIEADIKPFEGILLGIFFMTSGANLDPVLCLQEWPTLLSGILAVLGAKLGLIFVLGAFGFGLTRAEAIRIALLLAGGGEFAFVVFKLAEELELLEPKLSSLLTAAVIISMSLTPLLGEAAQYVSEAVERIDSKSTANVRADELFDVIDADGNGSIEKEELLSYLLGGGTAIGATRQNEAFDRLFTMLDLDGDGVISRQELRAGFTELICGEMREVALQDATGVGGGAPAADDALATEPDAVVVCGYGEMGQLACDVLADAEGVGGGAGAGELRDQVALPTGAWGTRFIAVDRNPSRVSIGLAKQVRVVYGDGASVELLRAAGVIRPRAIMVTFASDKRCLETTRRLREAFSDTPIFVRARTAVDAEQLLQAGATEVVIEAVESVVRFASLVSAYAAGVETANSLTRVRSSSSRPGGKQQGDLPPYPEEQLDRLAAECGITRSQICRLYDGFVLLESNEDGEVELTSIRDMLSSVGVASVDNDETVAAWMAEADQDGSNALSFFEYVRVDSQRPARAAPSQRPARSAPPKMMLHNVTEVSLLDRPAQQSGGGAVAVQAVAASSPARRAAQALIDPLVQAFDKSGLDRGDFRWEFLVPWLAEGGELTRMEETIVGGTFIVAALALQVPRACRSPGSVLCSLSPQQTSL